MLLCLTKSFFEAICVYLIGTRAQYKFCSVNCEQNNCIKEVIAQRIALFFMFVNFLSLLNDIEISSWDVQGHFGA